MVDVAASATLPLRCQRTLERFLHSLEQRSRLGLVRDEADDVTLPEDYEPLVVSEGQVALTDIVEDELILAVPLIPASAGESVDAGFGPAVEESENPFAKLGELGLGKR